MQAIKRMSTAAAPTLFVTRLTREPARTMTQPFMLIRLAVKGSIHSPAGTVERYLKMWTSARGRGSLAPLQSKTKAAINYIWNAARLSYHCNQMGPHREKNTLYHITCTADGQSSRNRFFLIPHGIIPVPRLQWVYSFCFISNKRFYQNQPFNRIFLCFLYAFCPHTHSNNFILFQCLCPRDI